MYSRALLSARNAVKAIVPRRGMATVTDYKPPTMSELPVPQGPWKEYYNAKQRKYNVHLLAGIVISGATLAYLVESEFMDFGFGPKIGK